MGLLVLVKLAAVRAVADSATANLMDSLRLSEMLSSQLANQWLTYGASLALVCLSWFIVLLVENCRVPFDDPNTHLELTMIHEVMVLDHSGPAFGMILYGAAMKLFAFAALIVHVALPVATGTPWIDWPVFIAGTLAVAVIVGIVESTMARVRLPYIPILLVAAWLLSAFGVILLMR
jgi:formate hydrogenlyase subunit 4